MEQKNGAVVRHTVGYRRYEGFATPYAWLSYTIQRVDTYEWSALGAEAARDRALALAQRAVQLEPGSALCQNRLAWVLVLHERWQEAAAPAHRAVAGRRNAPWECGPRPPRCWPTRGEPEEAIVQPRHTLAQDPLCPPVTRSVLGRALLLAGRPDQALPEAIAQEMAHAEHEVSGAGGVGVVLGDEQADPVHLRVQPIGGGVGAVVPDGTHLFTTVSISAGSTPKTLLSLSTISMVAA